jgi:hypothetical protein
MGCVLGAEDKWQRFSRGFLEGCCGVDTRTNIRRTTVFAFRILSRIWREGLSHLPLNDKESCMTQSLSEDLGSLMDPLHDEPLPRAKPHERPTHGVDMEDYFGICADEFDDEFMERLQKIQRGIWPSKETP